MRWFAVVSAATAPVLLIGGWTVAAALQPAGFDPLRDTISALAGHGAAHRWVMTVALLGVGVCHCVTAAALRPLATPARVMLAAGGAATVLVAAFPLPRTGSSGAHQLVATLAFACLAVWPALSRVPGGSPQPVPPALMRAGAAGLVILVGLFCAALAAGVLVGLAERLAAGAQSLWPLTTVIVLRRGAAVSGPR
ncbi:DUF998 domain-containing protein [Dactylosporangium aurantiacum]|uniref:DUF998 domain-containing protein n=1 Tax=Dactylosporangium aurantiacum TaxID=35754 RepID=A0A9Q9INK2_9ACTN|nr:DUF998 domain-containing protein [Dactylosporangium aurantiacum]MDG6109514.1 DUF998 domain-containing protein [Dactylosporangium aurantiacum]UWZ56355.1 DUF998 domain-containing protein [Dactylosporangium aurantiacum]